MYSIWISSDYVWPAPSSTSGATRIRLQTVFYRLWANSCKGVSNNNNGLTYRANYWLTHWFLVFLSYVLTDWLIHRLTEELFHNCMPIWADFPARRKWYKDAMHNQQRKLYVSFQIKSNPLIQQTSTTKRKHECEIRPLRQNKQNRSYDVLYII